MTVTVPSFNPILFEGVSTDIKPDTWESPGNDDQPTPLRSCFLETDTGDEYYYTGQWELFKKNGIPLGVTDTELSITRGLVPGLTSDNKFGRNTIIDSGIAADIWDGGHTLASGGTSLIWAAPTEARIHTIASDSADDDTGGIGANSVIISYLPDWDTKETTETVTGNLNAGIAMSNAAVMINRMKVIPQATSTSTNVGEITATAAVDNTVTARIRVGKGKTQMAIAGIPSSQTAYVGRLYGNINKSGGQAGAVDMTLLQAPSADINEKVFLVEHSFGLMSVGTSALSINYAVFKNDFEGPAILKIQAEPGSNGMDVSAGFDYVLEDI